MAGTLKSLLVRLGVDSKGFDKGMDKAEKRSHSLEKSFNSLTKIGGGIVLGAGAALVGTAVALASTIKPASDLEEAINAVNVVFGDGAAEIVKFGETSSMVIGLSSREFNQMSAEMGAMLGNVGIAEEDLADETINLMLRASDMASIFNTDVSQAFAAIQSAIKGEFNPLEAFGVKMNQARIDAKALSMGLVETSVDTVKLGAASIKLEKAIVKSAEATKEFGVDSLEARDAISREAVAQAALEKIMEGATGTITDSAKAQAALALVYEQTEKVAGDFQNTSDGLANSQRQLGGWIEDTKAKIGAKLLPALEGILAMGKKMIASPEFEKFLNKIIDGVGKLADWITETVPIILTNIRKFTDFLKDNKGVVVGVFVAMAVAVGAFAISLLPAIWGMITLIAPFLAIAAVAYLVYEAWTKNWGGIQEKTAAAKDFLIRVFNVLKTGVLKIWATIWKVLGPIFDAFKAAFEGDWYTFGKKLREAWDNYWLLIRTALKNAFSLIKTAVKEFLPKIKTWFLSVNWSAVGKSIITGIARGIASAAKNLAKAALKAVKAAWNAAKGFLRGRSPSMLFAELGKNMMLGTAMGIDQFAKVPITATVEATRGIATTAGRGGDAQPARSQQPVLNEAKLSRMIRDAILQVQG